MTAGSEYKLFYPKRAGVCNWLSLKIITKELNEMVSFDPKQTCAICKKPINSTKIQYIMMNVTNRLRT